MPVQPGRPRRQGYEYRRAGTRKIFLTCEPLAGWRHVAITQRRTMPDFARQMQWLVDVAYPQAPVVRVVQDNPNIRRVASLYETFPAAEARRSRNAWSHGGNRVQRIVPRLPAGTPMRSDATPTGYHQLEF